MSIQISITMKTYFLYILHSETIDRYYIGVSYDPEQRLRFHNTFPKDGPGGEDPGS
jgi:putative endonuclease